jgi:hypothetical protein
MYFVGTVSNGAILFLRRKDNSWMLLKWVALSLILKIVQDM